MCDVCNTKNKQIYKNNIHKKNLEPFTLRLCFDHDLELFKRGQDFFLLKYKYELAYALNEAIPMDKSDDFTDLKYT
jgi:hypothetical protein